MDQLLPFSDSRLTRGCIFCGGLPDTRDHIPSKCILDKPYPENLPVVGCCYECNQGFSSDEQYFACFIECLLRGSANIQDLKRPSIIKIFERSPALRKSIENSITEIDGNKIFKPEIERINNVLLKLAQGHVAFELSLILRNKPDHFWWGLLSSLSEEKKIDFESVHFQENVGEIGSRSMQRLMVTNIIMQDGSSMNMVINDWLDVQDDRYRYMAIDDMGMIIIRIVIDEFFGCEIIWEMKNEGIEFSN